MRRCSFPLLLLFVCVTINVYSFVIIFPVSALHVERVRKCVRGRASKFYVKFVQKEPFWCPLTAGTISSFSKWHWEIGTITTRSGFVRLELGIQENSNLKKRIWHLAVIIVCDKSIYRRMCGSISIVAEWKSWSSGDEIPQKLFIYFFLFLFFFCRRRRRRSFDR